MPAEMPGEMQESNDEKRCPVCGRGVFTDVSYEVPDAHGLEPRLEGDSYEVLTFSCGHEVRGAPLAIADPRRMTVEQRETEETVEPAVEEEER